MEYVGNEQLQRLMPQMTKIDFDQPLSSFVSSLKSDLSNPYLTDGFITPLVKSGNFRNYLEVVGRENSYTKFARRLERLPVMPLDETRDLVIRAHRLTRTMYVRERLNEFDAVREVICDGLQKMFDNPMFITDARFGYLVAMVEQSKTASEEMHLHFGNAFVHAYDRIPHMVLELSIRANESIKANQDDVNAELKRHRSRSQGMSM